MSLSPQDLEQIEKIIEGHGVTRRLSSGQKWDVALMLSSVIFGAVALAGLGIWTLLKETAEDSAANIAAAEVVRELRNDGTFEARVLAAAPSLPTGAVIAFNGNACPQGWSFFSEAVGRFVMGTTVEQVGQTGGEAEVALTIAQIPEHRHALPQVSSNTQFSPAGRGANTVYFDYRDRTELSISQSIEFSREEWGVAATGGSQPHNNIPPFVGLIYCQKTDTQ
ncbi:MAG: hypothetical protein AAF636_21390 [Pseudomonadota bacterium]